MSSLILASSRELPKPQDFPFPHTISGRNADRDPIGRHFQLKKEKMIASIGLPSFKDHGIGW
jgi:hypothetical protein